MSAFRSAVGPGSLATVTGPTRVVRAFSDIQSALNDGPGKVIVQKGGNWTNPDGYLDIHSGTLLYFDAHSILRTVFRVTGASDVIVRNGTFAPGVLDNVPAVATDGAQVGTNSARVIFDYCRFLFSRDECLSFGFVCDNVTAMRSILAWALRDSGHPDGVHSKGGMFHKTGVEHGALFQCALVHNDDRNYRCVGGGDYEIVNCLVHDWGTGIYVSNSETGAQTKVHVIGNNYTLHPTNKRAISGTNGQTWLVYLRDNVGNFTGLPAANLSSTEMFESLIPADRILPASAINADFVATIGPRFNDALSERLLLDVRTLFRGWIDSPDEVGGYPVLSDTIVLDSDSDGIPDEHDGQYTVVDDYVEDALSDNLIPPDIEPPFIQMILPVNNANVKTKVTLAGIVSDNIKVARIELLVGDVLLFTIPTPHTWTWTWNVPGEWPNGEAFLYARAFDDAGNFTTAVKRIVIRKFVNQ